MELVACPRRQAEKTKGSYPIIPGIWCDQSNESRYRIYINPELFSCLLVRPFYYLRTLSFSLSFPSNYSDPGSQSRLFSPPSPLRYAPSRLSRDLIRHFLPSSTRIERTTPFITVYSIYYLTTSYIFLFIARNRIRPDTG